MTLNGVEFNAYAQRVPINSETYEDIVFGIFLLVKKTAMEKHQDEVKTRILKNKKTAYFVITTCLTLFFVLIVTVICLFTQEITKPIGSLTKFT